MFLGDPLVLWSDRYSLALDIYPNTVQIVDLSVPLPSAFLPMRPGDRYWKFYDIHL